MFNTLVPNVAHPSSYHPQLLKSSRQNASITWEPERLQARKRNQAGPMGQATTQITGRSQTTPHWSGKDSRTEADRKTENDYKRERASPSRESVPTKSHQHQACSDAREHNREGQKARPLQRPREKDPRRVGKACRTRATKYQACSDARAQQGGQKAQAASQATKQACQTRATKTKPATWAKVTTASRQRVHGHHTEPSRRVHCLHKNRAFSVGKTTSTEPSARRSERRSRGPER